MPDGTNFELAATSQPTVSIRDATDLRQLTDDRAHNIWMNFGVERSYFGWAEMGLRYCFHAAIKGGHYAMARWQLSNTRQLIEQTSDFAISDNPEEKTLHDSLMLTQAMITSELRILRNWREQTPSILRLFGFVSMSPMEKGPDGLYSQYSEYSEEKRLGFLTNNSIVRGLERILDGDLFCYGVGRQVAPNGMYIGMIPRA